MSNNRKVAWRIHSHLQDTEDLTYLTLSNATNNIYIVIVGIVYRMRAGCTKCVKKAKKIEGFCYYLALFHYFCSDSLISLEN